jgi:hypothetical protein
LGRNIKITDALFCYHDHRDLLDELIEPSNDIIQEYHIGECNDRYGDDVVVIELYTSQILDD